MTRTERQELSVEKWKQSGCKSTVVATTGFGKTRIAIIAIKRFLRAFPTKRVLVVVPTLELQNQWNSVLFENNLSIVSVLVTNTAAKGNWSAEFLIVDEIHRVNSLTFRSVVENKNYVALLGLTATYERLDGLHKIVMDKYCPPCDTITYEEALTNKWVSPVKTYLVLLEVDNLSDYFDLNQKFLNSFSVFNNDFQLAMKVATDYKFRIQYCKELAYRLPQDKKSDFNKYITASAFNFIRTLKARKEFIYTHPKKLEIANLILDHRPNSKSLTFWKTIAMAEKLKRGYVLHSKQTKKKRSLTLSDYSRLTTGTLACSKALDDGLDCPGLNLAIVGGFDSSKISATQRKGRICRFEEGKEAEMFFLCIKGTVEENWARNALGSNYQTISENQLQGILEGVESSVTKNKPNTQNDIIFRF